LEHKECILKGGKLIALKSLATRRAIKKWTNIISTYNQIYLN